MGQTTGICIDFVSRAKQIFLDKGYVEEGHQLTSDGEIIWFSNNHQIHLIYCLPHQYFVSSAEVEACHEAQLRYRAHSSSLIAPLRFSPAAFNEAEKYGIDLRRISLCPQCS